MILAVAISIAALLILSIVVWNVSAWPRIEAAERVWPRCLSVLIPARDEEANLAACLDAVLRQGETVTEILIYDDHSSDATPRIIQEYAARDHRVRAVSTLRLPAGWLGKNFACARLAHEARGEWLLFLDADARLTDGAAARLIEEAHRREVTLLCGWPALRMASFWEKALMPMLNFVVFTLFPAPLSIKRDDASFGLAHGACILVERASYNAIGGHAALREEIFEDRRLAQLWRAKGERGLCLDGQEIVSVRMYASLGGIWSGFQKNFFPAFRHQSSFWFFLLLHSVVLLGPLVMLAWLRIWPVWIAAASVIAARFLLALRFRHPLWSALLHPLAEIILIAIGISSWWRCKSGRGVEWKGRQYRSSLQ